MLFYTNSLKPLEAQHQPSRSVGGFVSISPVSNDTFQNLFSEVSLLSEINVATETYCIAFKNNTADPILDITFTFELPSGSVAKFFVGFESASKDDCGNVFFEKIPNSSSKPVGTALSEITGDTFTIEQLTANSYIGVWFRREIIKTEVAPKSCAQLKSNYENSVEPVTSEQIGLKITWDAEGSESGSIS